MATGGISAINDRALTQVGSAGQSSPGVAGQPSPVPGATPGASAPTGYDPAGATYPPAGIGAAAAGTSAQSGQDVVAILQQLGLSDGQIATLASAGLSEADLATVIQKIAADPSIAAQIPEAPQGASGAASPIGSVGEAPSGPPAWNEKWRQKFLDLGAPPEVIQQLLLSGGMGADKAQLQQVYNDLETQIDGELKKLEKKDPELYEVMEAQFADDRASFVQTAAAVNAGEVPEDQLKQMKEMGAMNPGSMVSDMFLKTMLPWAVIPGWGALRVAASPLFGGKDPISKYPIHIDFWNQSGMERMMGVMDLAMAGGGLFAGLAAVRGLGQAARGAKIIAGNSKIAELAAKEGVNMSGMTKYLPGTTSNRFATAYSRFDDKAINSIRGMGTASEHGALANSTLDDILGGRLLAQSDSGLRLTMMGMLPSGRTALFNSGKEMSTIGARQGRETVHFDPRATGDMLGAELAKIGARRMPGAERAAALGKIGGANPEKMLEHRIFASAVKELGVPEVTGARAAFGKFRPSLTDDAIAAAKSDTPVPTGMWGSFKEGVSTNPTLLRMNQHPVLGNKWVRRGALATGAVGGVGALTVMRNKQGEAAQEGQRAGGKHGGKKSAAGADGAAASQATVTPELQAEAAGFLGMSAEQQAAYLQEQVAQIQAAMQDPALDKQGEAIIEARVAELEMLQQAAVEMGAGTTSGSVVDSAAGASMVTPGAAAGSPYAAPVTPAVPVTPGV